MEGLGRLGEVNKGVEGECFLGNCFRKKKTKVNWT